MSVDFNAISSQAMSLPPDQRFELAQNLLESVEAQRDDDADLIAEFDRRCADIDAGREELIPAEQAIREIRAKLHES